MTVTSGVPQGTVLGPLMFLIYINDIHKQLSSKIRLFADDALVYKEIGSVADAKALQADINILTEWASTWQMLFNAKKCYVMRIHRGRSSCLYNYTMCNTPLEDMEHHPYLGVEISNNLSWTHHITNVKIKANKCLNMVRQNFTHGTTPEVRETIYKSFMRPHLEYASSVWDPYTKKDINCLEAVQNRGARYACQDYERCSSVTAMKEALHWQTLQERRFIARQTNMYKTIHELHAGVMPDYVTRPAVSTRLHHEQCYNVLRSSVDAYRFSYLPRTIRGWNLLPGEIIQAPSVDCFKSRLTQAFTQGLIIVIYPKSTEYISMTWSGSLSAAQPLYIY